jgi:hypothetical protein
VAGEGKSVGVSLSPVSQPAKPQIPACSPPPAASIGGENRAAGAWVGACRRRWWHGGNARRYAGVLRLVRMRVRAALASPRPTESKEAIYVPGEAPRRAGHMHGVAAAENTAAAWWRSLTTR